MAFEENISSIIEILPAEVASKMDILITVIGAVGGLIVIYLVFTIWKFFVERKRNKILGEIRKDVKFIKEKLSRKK